MRISINKNRTGLFYETRFFFVVDFSYSKNKSSGAAILSETVVQSVPSMVNAASDIVRWWSKREKRSTFPIFIGNDQSRPENDCSIESTVWFDRHSSWQRQRFIESRNGQTKFVRWRWRHRNSTSYKVSRTLTMSFVSSRSWNAFFPEMKVKNKLKIRVKVNNVRKTKT